MLFRSRQVMVRMRKGVCVCVREIGERAKEVDTNKGELQMRGKERNIKR